MTAREWNVSHGYDRTVCKKLRLVEEADFRYNFDWD